MEKEMNIKTTKVMKQKIKPQFKATRPKMGLSKTDEEK